VKRANARPRWVSLQTAYLDAVDTLLDTQRETLAAGLRLQLLTGLDFRAVHFAP
jgi:cobalt-zinc-cadmium efflux system outer membrane protein